MPKSTKKKAAGVTLGVVPLAVALIYNALVPGAPKPSADAMSGPVLCEGDLSDTDKCHSRYPSGCSTGAKANYDFALNILKNQVKWTSTQPGQFRTTLAEFETLEHNLPQGLSTGNHGDHTTALASAGEGTLQGVVGYLYGAQPEQEESSNCGMSDDLPDHHNVDFHIYIGFDPDVAALLRKKRNKEKLTTDERDRIAAHALHSQAVIVEMTPHYRHNFHDEWTIDGLNAAIGDQVRIVGQLMVDNEHYRAGQDCALDPSHPKCWRATVWEIHPVTDFKLCSKEDGCSQNAVAEWTELGDAAAPTMTASTSKPKKGKSAPP